VDRFVIDEAHCVKTWSDFRTAYKYLDFKEKYSNVPILCLTASAKMSVREYIASKL